MSIKKPCRVYRCAEFVVKGSKWCKIHKPEMEKIEAQKLKQAGEKYDKDRPSPSKRGYGTVWQKIRKSHLRKHPLCVSCKQLNIIKEGEEVDHILPLNDGGTHHPDNLQTLCKSCHSTKTAQDKAKRKKGKS